MASTVVLSFTTNINTEESSMISELSSTNLMTTHTTTTTTSTTTTSTTTTSTTTTAPIVTSINATYRYIITSNFALLYGIINNAQANDSVQKMVDSSFNLPNFIITVLQIEILLAAKLYPYQYTMSVLIWFRSSRNDCNITCIDSSTLTPSTNLTLPLENGTLVSAYPTSKPYLQTNTLIVNFPTGGSSPGIPGQLGMGLGISFIGVLLIAEIIFLYWKYGLSNSPRGQEYGMTSY